MHFLLAKSKSNLSSWVFLYPKHLLNLNNVFLRAEISYKKKRGNQRIEEQPNKSYFEKRKEERERIDRGDVRIVLGASTDNDDN